MVRDRLHGFLRARTRAVLAERSGLVPTVAQALDPVQARAEALAVCVAAHERRLAALRDELAGLDQPFSGDMTVDRAWRRHPGAPAIFAAHHLPGCDGCSVRFDETLEEAAGAYGLDLGALLDGLNALLTAG